MTEYCMRCMLPTGGVAVCPHCGNRGGAMHAPHQLPPGTILAGRYLIGNVLGQGGFGITYIGRDLTLDKRVAIKEYYPSGSASRDAAGSPAVTLVDREQAGAIEEGKRRFLSEARALAQFEDEPGVVTVRDYFEANNTAYIVMEYLDGQDLRTYLKGKRFSADEIFSLMRPVMDALEKIHAVGVIHRDISPDNIMLLQNGTVKLMDFGAARQLDLSGEKSISVVLKTGYAPVEQCRSKGRQGPWTDIYALCATIYRCITGLKPEDALERMCMDEMKWPSELGFAISDLQEAVLKKGMAVRAEDRFQSIREMKTMLFPGEAASHALELEDDDVTQRLPRGKTQDQTGAQEQGARRQEQPKHKRTRLLAVLCVLVLLAGAGIWAAMQGTGHKGGVSQADVEAGKYMRIILTAHEDMAVRDFSQAVQTIGDRVAILCDGQPYEITQQDDRIELLLPRTVIEPLGLNKTMQSYISRSIAFSLVNYQQEQTDRSDGIPVTSSDLESFSIETEVPDGLSAPDAVEAAEKGGLEKLVFTEDFVQKNGEQLAQWGENLALAQDVTTSSSYWYCILYPAGDGRTFYITNTDGAVFAQLHAYNLQHDPLPQSFYFSMDVNLEAAWEDPATAAQPGTFQRTFDEITGGTVTLVYPWVDDSELPAEGRWADVCGAMKERLDILGQDYAFGTIETEDEKQIVVKTCGAHMSEPLLRLLEMKSTRLCIEAGMNQMLVQELAWVEQPDGTYALTVSVSGSNQQTLQEMLRLAAEQQCDKVYFKADDDPWLACDLADCTDSTTLTFDQGCFWNNAPIDGTRSWLVRLLAAIGQSVNLPSGVSKAQYQCNVDEDGVLFDADGFDISYADLIGQMRENILQSDAMADYDQAEIVSDGLELRVYLHMNTGKNFAAQAVELIKAIYEQSGFLQSPATGLYVYCIDENDLQKERARIWFCKTYLSGGDQPGYIWGGGVFAGGRMEEYKEELQLLIESDPFFQEKRLNPEQPFCDYETWW